MPCESPEEMSRQLDLSQELSREGWVVWKAVALCKIPSCYDI